MTSQQEGRMEALAPEAGLVALMDPVSFAPTLVALASRLLARPWKTLKPLARFGLRASGGGYAAAARALGVPSEGAAKPDENDRRFSDPAWENNPGLFLLLQYYLLSSALLDDLVEAAGLDEANKVKANYLSHAIADALAPTNFLLTNPTAIKKAFDTGGVSLARGLRNFLDDLVNNGGWPRQVDTGAFDVGRNLATTPGKVVYRNELMELIQYEPQTKKVFETPILVSPSWVNKYYILDLAPGRSFIDWAVKQGHTLFVVSYRNPDESMADVSLEDYLIRGPRVALDVVTEITGAPSVNLIGLCLGGTLAAMLLAHLAALGDDRIRSATLLVSLIDFADPGPIRCFVDPESVERISKRMERRGYLGAEDTIRTFRLLRANEFVWSYLISGWLMGEDPPEFDLLYWGADGTRMPAEMHSFYLRTCYLENRLVRGDLELAGTPLRLDAVTADIYLLGCIKDHIVPWRSAYASTRLFKGDLRFALSSSGHVAGLVSPPHRKASYWTNPKLPNDAEAWQQEAVENHGSWWDDWGGWIAARAGAQVNPPAMGGEAHPPISDAPGKYVKQS